MQFQWEFSDFFFHLFKTVQVKLNHLEANNLKKDKVCPAIKVCCNFTVTVWTNALQNTNIGITIDRMYNGR